MKVAIIICIYDGSTSDAQLCLSLPPARLEFPHRFEVTRQLFSFCDEQKMR